MDKSIFNNKEEIIKYLNDKYSIESINIIKINRGTANIYNIDNKYILKEFESNCKLNIVKKDISVVNYLKENGFNVPNYILNIDNNNYDIYKKRIIVVEEFIEGYIKEPNTGSYKNTIESATILGKLVQCLKDYPYNLPLNLKKLRYNEIDIKDSIKNYYDIKSKLDAKDIMYNIIINDLNDKICMLNNIKELINVEHFNGLTIMNTQGDFSVMQFIYREDKVDAIIDFAKTSQMPIVWEVIRSYSYIDELVINGEFNINNFIDYVKEFMKYVSLTYNDLKYMSYLYLYQLLNSNYGYKQYADGDKKLIDFAIYRTKLCRYLYNNCEVLSKELIKLK